jgi:hypothetical protein
MWVGDRPNFTDLVFQVCCVGLVHTSTQDTKSQGKGSSRLCAFALRPNFMDRHTGRLRKPAKWLLQPTGYLKIPATSLQEAVFADDCAALEPSEAGRRRAISSTVSKVLLRWLLLILQPANLP